MMDSIVEYDLAIFSAMNSKKLGAKSIVLHSDSRLMVYQYLDKFEAKDSKMRRYI